MLKYLWYYFYEKLTNEFDLELRERCAAKKFTVTALLKFNKNIFRDYFS